MDATIQDAANKKVLRGLMAMVLHLTKVPGKTLTIEQDVLEATDKLIKDKYGLRIRLAEDDSLVLNLESPKMVDADVVVD